MAEEDQKADVPAQSVSESTGSEPTTVDQARRFLADESVRGQSRDKKAEFLKTKGLQHEDIEKLLSEEKETESISASPSASPEQEPEAVPEKVTAGEPTIPQTTSPTPAASSTNDTPPIITYPEFLTHSPRPPPLITPSRLLDIVAVSGTAWTLLYGAARFIVSPMVETQTEARSDYYTHVNEKLSDMVEKLEDLVSEVPYKNGKPLRSQSEAYTDAEDDKSSSCDDPTEMFHRDIGTQTSPPPASVATSSGASDPAESTVDAQARRLARLSSAVKELSDMYTKRAEDTSNLHSGVCELRDEVDKVYRYPPWSESASMYGLTRMGRSGQQEDDEYKKTKDAIRSVKGVFLSSRMFPTAAAR
ncbi:peroxisomal membrane anchor protein conserved region-domain-containing protein [Apiospora sp. TS-2023a]